MCVCVSVCVCVCLCVRMCASMCVFSGEIQSEGGVYENLRL